MSDVDRSALHAVYRYALDRGPEEGFARSAVGPATGLSEEAVTAAVEELLAMGLLLGLAAGRLRAVAPGEAVSGVITPLERELRARRAAVEDTRAAIMSFLPLYERKQVNRERKNGFEVLPDLAAVRVAIADLTARARVEILTAQPGGARGEGVLAEASPRDVAALRRGVRMRVLYQHTARFSRGTGEYVDRVTGLGAQVRTLDDQFSRLLVFDDETAVISLPGDPLGAAVVREAPVVAFIRETYERLWLAAEPFSTPGTAGGEISATIRQAIMRLLMEGLTDNSIAVRLGMSVRTCRRHVAEIMVELGAQSRFQAGYLLAVQNRQEGQR
ncbi:helix-turn-helix transcriptional regulator [Streptomyces durbertensis]|nr:LuxR C-terminal-related transcriptional regulator [Streptomyces durbertensis]